MSLTAIASELHAHGVGFQVVTAAAAKAKRKITFAAWLKSIKGFTKAYSAEHEQKTKDSLDARGATSDTVDYWIKNSLESLKKSYDANAKASDLGIRQLKFQHELFKKFKKTKVYRSEADIKAEVKKMKNVKLHELTFQQFKDFVRYSDSPTVGTNTGVGFASRYRPDLEAYVQVIYVAILRGEKVPKNIVSDSHVKQWITNRRDAAIAFVKEGEKIVALGKKALPRGYKTLKAYNENIEQARKNLELLNKALK